MHREYVPVAGHGAWLAVLFTAYLSAGICFLNSTTHDEGSEISCLQGLFGVYHRSYSGWPL